jgi:hypothetical protein
VTIPDAGKTGDTERRDIPPNLADKRRPGQIRSPVAADASTIAPDELDEGWGV